MIPHALLTHHGDPDHRVDAALRCHGPGTFTHLIVALPAQAALLFHRETPDETVACLGQRRTGGRA
jgi:hypothetical protein